MQQGPGRANQKARTRSAIVDAAQALAKRIRMHVERLRRRADGAVSPQEFLERGEELRAALRIVLGDLRDQVALRVADRRVERHAQKVLVRAELLVGHYSGRTADDRAEQRVPGLLEAGLEARRACAGVRDADRDKAPDLGVNRLNPLHERGLAG